MLGLKSPPPDPAARLTAADLAGAHRALARRRRPGRLGGRADEPPRPHRGLAARAERSRARRRRLRPASGRLERRRRAARRGPPLPGGRLLGRRLLRHLQPRGLRLLVRAAGARQAVERPHDPRRLPRPRRPRAALGAARPRADAAPRSRWWAWASPGPASSPCPTRCCRTRSRPRRWASTWGSSTSSSSCPQILASVGLGWVMERFLGNDATKALLLGGAVGAPGGRAHPPRAEGGDGVAASPETRARLPTA